MYKFVDKRKLTITHNVILSVTLYDGGYLGATALLEVYWI